jgi:hypothetical protein
MLVDCGDGIAVGNKGAADRFSKFGGSLLDLNT